MTLAAAFRTHDIPILVGDLLAGAAKAYGPARLLARERKRDALDKLIASHAMALDVTLVTNNPADFAVYDRLRLENWVAGH